MPLPSETVSDPQVFTDADARQVVSECMGIAFRRLMGRGYGGAHVVAFIEQAVREAAVFYGNASKRPPEGVIRMRSGDS